MMPKALKSQNMGIPRFPEWSFLCIKIFVILLENEFLS